MKDKIMQLSGPKKLAVVAFAFGFIAMFAGNPYDNTFTNVNTKEIALSSMNDADKISVSDLADWIIKAKADYKLVDLRSQEKFEEYFIPSAYNVLPVDLSTSGLMRNEKILLYGDDNVISAQAWFLLKSRGYKGVYILDGGINAWKDQILFPKLIADATPEQTIEFNKMKEVSLYFGGAPQENSEQVNKAEIKMPELKAPVQTNLTTAPKKKKREGC